MSSSVGLTWNGVAMLMALGVFVMVFILTIIGALQKHRPGPAVTTTRPPPPWAGQPSWVRLHLYVAVLLLAVLPIVTPMPWLFFGQAGVPMVRLLTIGILFVGLYVIGMVAIALASSTGAAGASTSNAAKRGDDPATHVELVARITQRFCPQCRAPLAVDAPEGLCPACLMAGGLASAVDVDPANGMAVTTPPSGSRPPAAGEWIDLAQHFPQLEILELLGRGGMGAVYKARQKHLDRMVALKVIPPEAAKDPTFAERFAREARALARLNHPNIVTVYDFGQNGDVYYLLMEYVDGVNLRHAQQGSRLSPPEALAIVPQICDALQYAHDQGVVHRDIKPENVLLDRLGRVKIADFGLAKMLGKGPADFTLTGTQQVMGTPKYMAPEQIEKPSTVDHRADIYSLGVMIYEMLTGELPIGRFQPPSEKVQVDVRIDQVVLRALEKEPERRYQRASQVKTDLATAAPPSWHTPAPAYKRQTPAPNRPRSAWPSVVCPDLADQWQTTSSRGDVPLNQVLAVAIGMVLGVLLIAAGLATAVYGLAATPLLTGPWWGWMGAAMGCICGGFGSLVGSYNTYRQVAGAEDLMKSPRTTWFDWTIQGYLVFGLILLGIGLAVLFQNQQSGQWKPLLTFAVIVVGQAGLFLVFRALMRLPGGSLPSSMDSSASSSSIGLAIASALATGVAMLRGLKRSKTDVAVGGVCGGLGRCTPIPAAYWRLLFLVLASGYGFGVVAYFVLWICLPEAEEELPPPPAGNPVTDWMRRMARSGKDVMVGGVCGGLGEHTPLPTWCWRVLFLGSLLAFGFGVVPYILLWICLPQSPPDSTPEEKMLPQPQATLALAPARRGHGVLVGCLVGSAMLVAVAVVFAFVAMPFVDVSRDEATVVHPRTTAASSDFGDLLKALRSESFDPGKVSFIKLVSRDNTFTSDQARQLLREFSFDPGREEAAVMLYPRVTDPRNFFLALTAIESNPQRQSVIKRLELDRPPKAMAEQPGEAVSRQEFEKLLTAVRRESFDEGKFALIKVVSQSGVFTCEQARLLLKAFSFDAGQSGREEAAVALYPRLSDPQNFYTLLETFEFDANRKSVRKRLELN